MQTFEQLRQLQEAVSAANHFALYENVVNQLITEDKESTGPAPIHVGAAAPQHPFKVMKHGASAYFSASPEEQKKIHSEVKQHYKPGHMFTDEASNPKLAKNGTKVPSYHTKGLFLAPANASGREVCSARSPECTASCLGSEAGRAKMKPVMKARSDRTNFMFDHPKHFYAQIDHEITQAKHTAHKNGQKLAVRLNGTSDIPHEHIAPQLFAKHHDVQFYDYTKLAGRSKHPDMPKNYHLTASSTGLNHVHSNWNGVRAHLDRGGTAAMVFKVRPGKKASPNGSGGRSYGGLPTHVHDEETGKKYRVIDGDEHDHRHLDKAFHGIPEHEGVIAGLRLKTAGGGWSEAHKAKAGKFAVDVHGHEEGRTDPHGHAVAQKMFRPHNEEVQK